MKNIPTKYSWPSVALFTAIVSLIVCSLSDNYADFSIYSPAIEMWFAKSALAVLRGMSFVRFSVIFANATDLCALPTGS